MNLTDPQELGALLKKFAFHTNKDLGQNFLVCEKTLKDIVKAARITEEDDILEIGPGPGVLTQELLKSPSKSVTALEIDHKVIPVLQYVTKNNPKLTIHNVSALEFNPKKQGYLLIANIPYYLTSPIFRHYLSHENSPKRAVFLVQKEVAEKVCAKSTNQSILCLEVGIYGKASIEFIVPNTKFFPAPKVDSAVLKIVTYDQCLVADKYKEKFWSITKQAYSQKRKKIGNTLGKTKANNEKTFNDIFEKLQIDQDRRPQTLSIQEWISVCKEVYS